MSSMTMSKPQREVATLLAEARIKPHQRNSLLLGNFTADELPLGFSIEINTDSLSSVSAQTKIIEATEGRRFVSYITNDGDKPVRVKIWQL